MMESLIKIRKPYSSNNAYNIEAYTCEDPLGAFVAASYGQPYDPTCNPDLSLPEPYKVTPTHEHPGGEMASGTIEEAAVNPAEVIAAVLNGANALVEVGESLVIDAGGDIAKEIYDWAVSDEEEDQ